MFLVIKIKRELFRKYSLKEIIEKKGYEEVAIYYHFHDLKREYNSNFPMIVTHKWYVLENLGFGYKCYDSSFSKVEEGCYSVEVPELNKGIVKPPFTYLESKKLLDTLYSIIFAEKECQLTSNVNNYLNKLLETIDKIKGDFFLKKNDLSRMIQLKAWIDYSLSASCTLDDSTYCLDIKRYLVFEDPVLTHFIYQYFNLIQKPLLKIREDLILNQQSSQIHNNIYSQEQKDISPFVGTLIEHIIFRLINGYSDYYSEAKQHLQTISHNNKGSYRANSLINSEKMELIEKFEDLFDIDLPANFCFKRIDLNMAHEINQKIDYVISRIYKSFENMNQKKFLIDSKVMKQNLDFIRLYNINLKNIINNISKNISKDITTIGCGAEGVVFQLDEQQNAIKIEKKPSININADWKLKENMFFHFYLREKGILEEKSKFGVHIDRIGQGNDYSVWSEFQYLKGESLGKLLSSEKDKYTICYQLLVDFFEEILFLHNKLNIVHRDLHFENVIVSNETDCRAKKKYKIVIMILVLLHLEKKYLLIVIFRVIDFIKNLYTV